jgi:dihydrofolate reductase
MEKRKVVLYISMSLDGFIATKDDDLSWLEIVQKEGLDYGYEDMMNRVDTYIIGRKTYEVIKELTGGSLPQAKTLDCYVLTRQKLENEERVTFYNGDIKRLITKLKSQEGKDIYCDGGGQAVKMLMEHNLVDEFIISVIPIILGDGKRLFIGGTPMDKLQLVDSQKFKTGLVQLHYKRKN